MTNEIAEKNDKKLPITDQVMNRVTDLQHSQGFTLPKGYNASNALNKALIYLQTTPSTAKGAKGSMIETSDPKSVAQALFDMVIQGLSPNQTQVYFIQRHNYQDNTIKLELQRSYFGTQMVLKRLPEIHDVQAFAVYDGDELETDFDIETMRNKVTKFHNDWRNQDNAIIAALCVIYMEDGSHEITVMTWKQIQTAWEAAKTKNVQNKFPDEMAKRTVINRAAKNIINTSNGNADLLESITNTSENEYDNQRSQDRRDVTNDDHRSVTDLLSNDGLNEQYQSQLENDDQKQADDDVIDIQDENPYEQFTEEQGLKQKEAVPDGDERTGEAVPTDEG